MAFIPDDFIIPEKLETDKFLFRKLCYADAKLDYEAVMSSINIIHQTRGGTWPTADLTYLDDQIDLAWHQREFEFRSTFAYTIMNLDETECLGCLYIYPAGFRDEKYLSGDADVSFWVTQKSYNSGLYPIAYQTLRDWLRQDWPFQNPIFTNKLIPT